MVPCLGVNYAAQRKTRFGPFRNFFRMKLVSDPYFGSPWDGDSNTPPPRGVIGEGELGSYFPLGSQ